MTRLEQQPGFQYTQSSLTLPPTERITALELAMPDGRENDWFLISDSQSEQLNEALTAFSDYEQQKQLAQAPTSEDDEGIALMDDDPEEQALIDNIQALVRAFLNGEETASTTDTAAARPDEGVDAQTDEDEGVAVMI